MNENNNKKIWLFDDENKKLVRTSNIMLFGSLIGLMNKEYMLSPITMVAAYVSKLFWLSPRNDNIRLLDILLARSSSFLYIGYIHSSIKNTFVNVMYPIFYISAIGFYLNSCYLHSKRNRMWFVSHYMSHNIAILIQMTTITYRVITNMS
jgi:hypothetical protein